MNRYVCFLEENTRKHSADIIIRFCMQHRMMMSALCLLALAFQAQGTQSGELLTDTAERSAVAAAQHELTIIQVIEDECYHLGN
jgi:hypothetical protein